jgi:hypothetical protein
MADDPLREFRRWTNPFGGPVGDTLMEELARRALEAGTGTVASALKSPLAVGMGEEVYPGAGELSYGVGAGAQGIKDRLARERKEASAAREARVAQITGGGAAGPRAPAPQAPPPQVPDVAQTEFVGELRTPFVGPTPEMAEPPSQTAHLDRLGVEPWKVDEWRKQAMAADAARGNTGPFRIRETGGAGRGGFTPSAQPPMVAGMDAAQYEAALAQQSPGVQRLMEESRARAMRDAAQAAAIEQAQAQGEGYRASAEEAKARAAMTQRAARSLPEQVQEQGMAVESMRNQILTQNPLAKMRVEEMMAAWAKQNPQATPQDAARMQQFIAWTVADQMMPGILNLQQAVDPEFASAYARATGMMAGGGY